MGVLSSNKEVKKMSYGMHGEHVEESKGETQSVKKDFILRRRSA